MTVFLSTLNRMAFLFVLILLGYVLVKCKVLKGDAAGVLSKLESFLFVPALVLGTFIGNFTVEQLQNYGILFLSSFAVLAFVIPLSILAARVCSRDGYIRKIYTYGLAFSNFGFMGNAIVMALLPEIFASYLIFTLPLWMAIYLWGVPSLLIADSGKQTIRQRLKGFVNPMFICMIIGMIIGIAQIPLPGFLTEVIDTAGSCMSPLAMLLTGMTVAEIDLKKIFRNGSIYAVSVFRLLVFPLLGIGAFRLLSLFFPLSETFILCAVCSLAMPLGLNTIVIPRAYGKDTTVAAGMALISNILACGTIPLIFLLMNLIFGFGG